MIELFIKGGWVMYAILTLSVVAVGIIIERFIFFAWIRNDDLQLFKDVEAQLGKGNKSGALEACKGTRGPVSQVLTSCLQEWERGCDSMENSINFEANRAVDLLEKNLRGLSVVAQSAPLLGLLGTVIGMIRAFMTIEAAGGQVNVASLAGGIWEALITTAFGLIVAIPALFAYNFFETRVDRCVRLLRDIGERLLNLRRARG